MPTTRTRHMITETDEVARALDAAAEQWPEDAGARSRLLHRLVNEGYRAILDQRRHAVAARREAVLRTSGALTGSYPDDYLARLRDEWPA